MGSCSMLGQSDPFCLYDREIFPVHVSSSMNQKSEVMETLLEAMKNNILFTNLVFVLDIRFCDSQKGTIS